MMQYFMWRKAECEDFHGLLLKGESNELKRLNQVMYPLHGLLH